MNTRPTDNPQSTYSQGSIQDFSFRAEVFLRGVGGGEAGHFMGEASTSQIP